MLEQTENVRKLFSIKVETSSEQPLSNLIDVDYPLLVKFGVLSVNRKRRFDGTVDENLEFFHYTFMEYFAALWFAENSDELQFEVNYIDHVPETFRYILLSENLDYFKEVSSKLGVMAACYETSKILQMLQNDGKTIRFRGWNFDNTNIDSLLTTIDYEDVTFVKCTLKHRKSILCYNSSIKEFALERCVIDEIADNCLVESLETMRALKFVRAYLCQMPNTSPFANGQIIGLNEDAIFINDTLL